MYDEINNNDNKVYEKEKKEKKLTVERVNYALDFHPIARVKLGLRRFLTFTVANFQFPFYSFHSIFHSIRVDFMIYLNNENDDDPTVAHLSLKR